MDISTKYNDYQSLGQEFLTCLYFKANTQKTLYQLGKKVVFTKFDEDKVIEKTVISGDYTDSDTGKLLLSENAIITEMQIILFNKVDEGIEPTADDKYIMTLKASDLSLNGFKTPKIEKSEDYEANILLKMEYVEIAFEQLDELYKEFLGMRLSDKYDNYKDKLREFANIKD